jgi:hypothetical protein
MTSGLPQPSEEPAHDDPNVASAGQPDGPTPPARGAWFGVAAAVLGVLALALPWAPVRAALLLAFGLPGLAVGIIGCAGRRRGRELAILGSLLSVIAVVMGTVMVVNANRDTTSGYDNHTEQILRDELDVRLGERYVDAETGIVSVTVTLYNKGQDVASYSVTIQLEGRDSDDSCEDGVRADNLAPGASYQEEVHCSGKTALQDLTVQVTEATKNRI